MITWLDERLAEHGARRTGDVELVSDRPWATVRRAPTTIGDVWLKAGAEATAFEAGLYGLLAEVAPDRVLTPLGVDAARGWVLLPGGGTPLGARLQGEALVDALAEVLPPYGELQRRLAPHVERMLALGVADMRPHVLPQRFAEALAVLESTPAAVREAAPDIERWARELAAAPGGASLDHNDLHGQNVLDGARFYDWGDSVVAHPFASMLLTLTLTRDRVGARAADRLRDAYLEAWDDLAPRAELLRTLELACRLGKIARALVWHRADPRFAAPAVKCLASVLEPSHLGGT